MPYVSKKIPVPPIAPDAVGGELILYGVSRRGRSYRGHVFVNAPRANLGTPLEPGKGYVGSYTVFGHGGCVGDEGHCDQPTEPDETDIRDPVGLTRLTMTVGLSREALDRIEGETFTVTLVPVAPSAKEPVEVDLDFEGFRLATYEP
jgi:tyrosinase